MGCLVLLGYFPSFLKTLGYVQSELWMRGFIIAVGIRPNGWRVRNSLRLYPAAVRLFGLGPSTTGARLADNQLKAVPIAIATSRFCCFHHSCCQITHFIFPTL